VRKPGRAGLVWTVVLAVGLASACGSAGSASISGTGASAGQGTAINVGLIGEFSGAFGSSFGGIPDVMKAWASVTNAQGGIGGRQVHVIPMDAAVGLQPGLGYAKQLIGQDHVVAIIDADGTPDDATWIPYATAAHVPIIFASPLSQSKVVFTDPGVFPVIGESPQIEYAFAASALALGPKFGAIYCAESASCAATSVLLKTVGATLGLTLPVNVPASSSAPDYTAVCQDLKSSGVQSYFLAFASAAAKRIADTCYQQGVRIPQLLAAGTAATFWKTDPAFAGAVVLDKTAPYFASTTPAQKAYRSALAKYTDIAGTDLDNAVAMWAWSAGQLITAASRHATGTLTAASLTAGLYQLKGETLGGLVQPLTFVAGKPTWLRCNFVWKVTSGGFTVSDPKPVCASEAEIASITNLLMK